MNWEQVGIGMLCVSQGLMWWRNVALFRYGEKDNAKAVEILRSIEQSTDAILRDTRMTGRHDINRADFGALRDEIRQALDRLPKKRNTRKKAPPPEASSDPVGPVAS